MLPVRKLLLFALLGCADFALTWYLLRTNGQAVYEGNPVAAWCLARFGWLGLAGFKGATMGVAAGLGALISLRRPRAGQRLLAFGCAVLAAVVLYSGYLSDAVRRRPTGLDAAEAAPLAKEAERLEAARRRSLAYRDVMIGVVGDLCARHATLRDGVERLAATEQARDGDWLRRFRTIYPGCGDEECLAVSVINHVEVQLHGTTADRQLTHDLKAEYRALYGRAAPALAQAARVPAPPGRVPGQIFAILPPG